VLRRELGQLCLDLHAAGLRDPHALAWLDAPPEPALAAAEDLLHRLGALDPEGCITPFGRQLAKLPLHPRLAALCLHGGAAGCAEAARLAAGNRPQSQQIEQQLRRLVPAQARLKLPQALLQAFPDRVARRRKDKELLLSNGASAVLLNDAGVEKARFLVALDIEERPDQGLPLVREASAIEPEWLLDQFAERVRDQTTVEWNRQGERVEAVSAIYYDELLLEESRGAMPPAEAAASLLAHKAVEAGIHRFADAEAVSALEQRVAFAGGYGKLPALDVEAVLRGLCYGLRGFTELIQLTRDGGLERALVDSLGTEGQRALDRLAPERIALPSGRKAKVHYAPDQTPWVASRLQDFFGLAETPRIAGGAVSLVVHLLAPNQRPVQTTQDLAGFWQRLYPQVRKELSRRYPRHAWPENPYTAYKD